MRSSQKYKVASLGALLDDRSGNIAMMWGLLLVPLVLGLGLAIDGQRRTEAATVLQEAADAANLAAARHKSLNPNATDGELTALARKLLDAAISGRSDIKVASYSVTHNPVTGAFDLSLEASLPNLFMRVGSAKSTSITTRSQVSLGEPTPLEITMALDVTGSMNSGGKIGSMKLAAKDLVEALFKDTDPDVKIGLVPFALYVNVGVAHKDAAWLENPGPGFSGCVGSRSYPNNLSDYDYTHEKVPGIIGVTCPPPILPLSTDKDKIVAAIDSLTAAGPTYIPSGLVWAWRALSPGEPLTGGEDPASFSKRRGVKAVILLTDGMNTRSPTYPLHNGKLITHANELTERLCENIKKEKLEVFTIAFDVSDETIKGILQTCASSPGYYFDARDSSSLKSAFVTIGNGLRDLRISR